MTSEAELVKSLRSQVAAEAVAAAEELGERRYGAAVAPIINVLRTTNDHVVRNAMAMALRDIGDPAAADAIAEMLRDSRTEESRGTLLYALSAFDCTPFVDLLRELAASAVHEVRVEAERALRSVSGRTAKIQNVVLTDLVDVDDDVVEVVLEIVDDRDVDAVVEKALDRDAERFNARLGALVV